MAFYETTHSLTHASCMVVVKRLQFQLLPLSYEVIHHRPVPMYDWLSTGWFCVFCEIFQPLDVQPFSRQYPTVPAGLPCDTVLVTPVCFLLNNQIFFAYFAIFSTWLFLLKTFKALNGLLCVGVPLRNCSLTYQLILPE